MILAKRYEKWGIDADLQIVDSHGIPHIITVRFDSDAQIESDLASREAHLIANCDADYDEVNYG